MLMYEGFLNKMLELMPEYKIAKIFVDFLNSVDSNLKCYYKSDYDAIWIFTKNEDRLISINISGTKDNADITFYSHHIELTEDMLEFFKYIFKEDTISIDMNKTKILDVMKNLTKSNFDIFKNEFLLKKDAKKYNL